MSDRSVFTRGMNRPAVPVRALGVRAVLTGSASSVSEEVRTCARQAPLRKAPACRRRPPGSGYSGRGCPPKQRPTLTPGCGFSFSLGRNLTTVDTAGNTTRRRGCCRLMHCMVKRRDALLSCAFGSLGASLGCRLHQGCTCRNMLASPARYLLLLYGNVRCAPLVARCRLRVPSCMLHAACCPIDVASGMLCVACSTLS